MHSDNPDADTLGQVLMATYNGAAHVQEQLHSIAAQSLPDWALLISDDGSTDGTRDLLDRFVMGHPGRVTVREGPRAGFVANFLSLIQAAEPGAPWLALCDQDDVWLPQKLDRAVSWLAGQDGGRPALYCSSAWVCGPSLRRRKLSPIYRRPPAFANALVQNIASGNTVVMNRAAATLARACAPHAGEVFAHDWWLYLLISGAGGEVFFDPEPGVLYRQHGTNEVGHGRRLRHVPQVLAGRFADRVSRNLAALEPVRAHLDPAARRTLDLFAAARAADGVRQRLDGLRRSSVYRQTPRGQLGLTVAMALNRV